MVLRNVLVCKTKRFTRNWISKTDYVCLRYSNKAFVKYGPELYAAYFACYLRGKSRIEGTNKWITFDDTRNENILPDTYYNVKVEGLDFSNVVVNNNFQELFAY